MQDESFGEVLLFPLIQLSKNFNFHSVSHNQSHKNQINNHNYLFNITFQNLEFWDVTISLSISSSFSFFFLLLICVILELTYAIMPFFRQISLLCQFGGK